MRKKIICRGLMGFPLGIAIGQFFSILGSLIYGGGHFSCCVPELVTLMGSEIAAVILQTFLCGLLGAGGAVSSVIWEVEKWGLLKQTIIAYVCLAAVFLPVSYFLFWMEHSVAGFFIYLGIFSFIFLMIWVIQYSIWFIIVKKLNRGIQNINEKS